MVTRSLVLAAAGTLLAGCFSRLRTDAIVEDARVLAIRVEVVGDGDYADADTGDQVRLTALLANPLGRTPVSARWLACLPVDGQAVTPCEDQAVLRDPSTVPGRPGVVELGEGSQIEAPVPAELAPALAATLSQVAGNPGAACSTYYDVPVLVLVQAGDVTIAASKRVRLMPYREDTSTPPVSKYVRNVNPRVVAVRADPTTDACLDGTLVTASCTADADCAGGACVDGWCTGTLSPGQHRLCALPADDAAQPFVTCNQDGSTNPVTEDLRFRWYATDGSFDTPSGRAGRSTPADSAPAHTFYLPAAGPYDLWLVVRDGRGGESWVATHVQ